jgi:hypothetical protein
MPTELELYDVYSAGYEAGPSGKNPYDFSDPFYEAFSSGQSDRQLEETENTK